MSVMSTSQVDFDHQAYFADETAILVGPGLAAEMADMSVYAIRKACNDGSLAASKGDSSWRIKVDSLADFVLAKLDPDEYDIEFLRQGKYNQLRWMLDTYEKYHAPVDGFLRYCISVEAQRLLREANPLK